MTNITLIGVDPGLIDTGVSCLTLDQANKTWSVEAVALSAEEVHVPIALRNYITEKGTANSHVFVEKWRERGSVFNEHSKMRELESGLRRTLPSGAKFLENMGVKKLISNKLLDLCGLLHVQTTNHQDIQAAARIMLLGAIKNEDLNKVLYAFITDALDGKPWAREGVSA